jgi:hypothetical protein
MHRTLDEIPREGLAALRERLGRAGLIRFLQQFELGSGNYARDRHAWVDAHSLDDLNELILQRRQGRRRKSGKSARRAVGGKP